MPLMLQPKVARILQPSRLEQAVTGLIDREWVESMTETVAYLCEVVSHLEQKASLRDHREVGLEG
jgi:hypothetical protein